MRMHSMTATVSAVLVAVAWLLAVACAGAAPPTTVSGQAAHTDAKAAASTTPENVRSGAKPVGDNLPLPAPDDPRSGVKIQLVLDKEEYFLGENVLLHCRIENAGKEPFAILAYGYHGHGQVEAVDEQGRAAEKRQFGNGPIDEMIGQHTLKPGEVFWESEQLMHFVEFSHSGTYTITVRPDLGWENSSFFQLVGRNRAGPPPAPCRVPTATAKVRLVMPTTDQARAVAVEMLDLPKNTGGTMGQRRRPFCDVELLRYPVYLPIIKGWAEHGYAGYLMDALGAMAFPEATAVLLDLTSDKDPKIAAQAADLLWRRLPGTRGWSSEESRLPERSWDAGVKVRALAVGWRLLAQEDRESRLSGARFVAALGGPDDLPKLIAVMDKLLVAYQNDTVEQGAYLQPATVCGALIGSALDLARRGATPPSTVGDSPGRAVAFLAALQANEKFRPNGWSAVVQGLLRHPIPCVRAFALASVPLPLDQATTDIAVTCLKDRFDPVAGTACGLAERAKSEQFRQPLLELLRTARNPWLIRGAFNGACACGVRDQALEGCVRRLSPNGGEINDVLLEEIIHAVECNGYGHDDAYSKDKNWTDYLSKLQQAWLDLIAANRPALRAGLQFKIGQPPLRPEMFPPGYQFRLEDGSDWPQKTKSAVGSVSETIPSSGQSPAVKPTTPTTEQSSPTRPPIDPATMAIYQRYLAEYNTPRADPTLLTKLAAAPDADLCFLDAADTYRVADSRGRSARDQLGKLNTQRTFDIVAARLKSGNQFTREEAIWILGAFSRPECVTLLIELLRDDPVAQVRGDAATALGPYADARSEEPLLKAARQDEAWVALRAATSLADLKSVEGFKAAVDLLRKVSDGQDYEMAQQAVSFYRCPAAVDVLLKEYQTLLPRDDGWGQRLKHDIDVELTRLGAVTFAVLGPKPDTLPEWQDWWVQAKPLLTDDLKLKAPPPQAPPTFRDEEYGSDSADLTLTASLDGPPCRMGDPIRLDLWMTNASKKTYRIIPPHVPSGWWPTMAYGLRLVHDGKPVLDLAPSDYYLGSYSGPPSFETLAPGSKFHSATCLQQFLKPLVALPLAEGDYELTVTFDSAKFSGIKPTGVQLAGRWTAKPVKFTVKGAAALDPADLLHDISVRSGIKWLASDLTSPQLERREPAWRTVFEYGDSRLAPFVAKIETEQPDKSYHYLSAKDLRPYESPARNER